ncbi:D-alanyl-D-alanine-carboxypeptidase/endopeptidase AmpH [Frondihabitans sp. 762G35]|uniref:serine hydrolase domain-containing protein n=1 Tax=Frondihabitans sp. 762G35 TaxID=1446794 RepID=UPI000D22430A|nr:serine hydrolase domain-containing protein [Frondihabitans sp. 762G35]ARC57641.1 D-alanyl-D-alanine-carboxypeptidase/endopeptidase AmpH [Frondihabitans sp. 762G35]
MTLDAAVRRAAEGTDRLFASRAAERHAPSASYGVFTPSGLVHTGSTGEVAGRAPTADTVYRVASCTKSFTATALLALRDRGAVSLDEPVTAYVPAFADVVLPTFDSPVPTLRMLLTMSAGLPTDDPWGDRQESLGDDEFDALLRRGLRFDSVPGTRFAYSNLGYALLGRVVTVASGRPYREVVSETVLAPLGLDSTTFERPASADDRLAVGHRPVGDGWEPLPFSGPGAFSSIGGLFSTVRDLARWAGYLASAFSPQEARGDAPTEILSRASRRELQQLYRSAPLLPGAPTGYGFGLFVHDDPDLGPVVSHSGGYPGFSAHMRWHTASGVGIVAFENATAAQVAVPAAATLHGLLLDVGAAPAPRVWPETLEARLLVEAALRGADLPEAAVSENVELDVPFVRRRAAWDEVVAAVGGLLEARDAAAAPSGTVDLDATVDREASIDREAGEESSAPSHLVWRMPGAHGRLRVEVRLTPEARPRIQTLVVRAESGA